MRERTVRISEEEWNMINQARNTLAHQGYNSLPTDIQKEYQLDEFTKGAIIGLALTILLHLLAKKR